MTHSIFGQNAANISARQQRREAAATAQKQANKLGMAVSYVVGTRPDMDAYGRPTMVKQIALALPRHW